MSKKNRKPRQLSEQDVYRDAAKILEEILENKLRGKSLPSNSSTTYSSSGYYDASRESLDLWLKDDASTNFSIERSQTMPSNFKLEEKDEFTENDIEEYMKNKSDFANRRHSGSATSGESDVLDNRVGPTLRRKKSFFKRARERLSITLRRQEQGKENEKNEKNEEDDKKVKRKKKKPKDNNKNSKIEENGEDEFNGVELRRGIRNRSDSTASKRGSFFESIRKSFRSKRKSSSTIYESQSADQILDKKDAEAKPSRASTEDPSRNMSTRISTGDDSRNTKNTSSVVLPVPESHSVVDLDDIQYIDEDAGDKTKNGDKTTNNDKTNETDKTNNTNKTNDTDKTKITDDIKDTDKIKDTELPKPKENRNKPAPPPPKAPPIHHNSLPLGDGHTSIASLDNVTSDNDDVDSPDKKESSDKPFHEKSDEEKNDVFEKIAIKLMDMADQIKSSSDTEGSKTAYHSQHNHSSSVDPDHLTALEQDLLDCLRVGGDRLSQTFDDPIQVVIEEHRKKAYSRFYDTLRKGLGDEISWNQLSIIYQTATGAVKAAGVGTQLAFRVKDMTQQYVGDKFANWIVNEGGWDSMLSESESEVPEN